MPSMPFDREACLRAIAARDPRFDGSFVTAVTSTRIYCRPSCPARTPAPHHVQFYATCAEAVAAGFRPCKRCRPDEAPPAAFNGGTVADRAMRLIRQGALGREGVSGLASQLGYSPRQLRRHLRAALGAGPVALWRAERVALAGRLLRETTLSITDVSAAAGFGSLSQFYSVMREWHGEPPEALRRRVQRTHGPARREPGFRAALALPFRGPFSFPAWLWRQRDWVIGGLEEWTDAGQYRRALRLPHGLGALTVGPVTVHSEAGGTVAADLWCEEPEDFGVAVAMVRRLLDLDADMFQIAHDLSRDAVLGPLVAQAPGRRLNGQPDPQEALIRTIVGQQISVSAARTVIGRVVAAGNARLPVAWGAVTHAFPTMDRVAALDPADLPMTTARARTLLNAANLLASGKLVLHLGVDREEVRSSLQQLRGVGPWTAAVVAMRALGDPDVFLATDLGVKRALGLLGLATDAAGAAHRALAWSPWRSYAVQHLWALQDRGVAVARQRAGAFRQGEA